MRESGAHRDEYHWCNLKAALNSNEILSPAVNYGNAVGDDSKIYDVYIARAHKIEISRHGDFETTA